jgi:hypothetical protein
MAGDRNQEIQPRISRMNTDKNATIRAQDLSDFIRDISEIRG